MIWDLIWKMPLEFGTDAKDITDQLHFIQIQILVTDGKHYDSPENIEYLEKGFKKKNYEAKVVKKSIIFSKLTKTGTGHGKS